MMSDREKLIDIITDYANFLDWERVDGIADTIMSKCFATDNNAGDKWIPVSEQAEPTENGTYLCHGYWFGSRRKQTETADFYGEWNIANNFILTHWMPLPELPKECE